MVEQVKIVDEYGWIGRDCSESICLSSIHLSIYLYTFYLSLYLPSYIFIYVFIYLQDMDGLVEIVRRSLTSIDGPAMFLYTLQGIGVEPELEK